MPKIITSTGVVKYKTVPIYLGIKQIDKIKSEKNLALLKKVLDKHNVSFLLFYGTLLGAVREKDFITHDEDIDLAILDEERLKFIDSIPDLMSVGFKVARYDRRGLLSIIKDGEYIDFYFFSKYNDNLRCCSGILCPDEFLENFTTVSVGYQERLTFPDNGEYTIVVTVMGEIVFEEEVSIFAN